MAYPYTRQDYDDSKPLFVVRPFLCSGEQLQPGDRFDREKLGVQVHQSRAFWRSHLIDHDCPATGQTVGESAPAMQPGSGKPVVSGSPSVPTRPEAAGITNDSRAPKRREGARQ